MKQEALRTCSDEDFMRATGVKRKTFEKMMEVLTSAFARKRERCGRRPKLSVEEMLLATLEYLRENRTYAHIAASYGIAESNMYRAIKWVKDALLKSGVFSLPGKKAPLKEGSDSEVVLAGAAETPEERDEKKE